MSAVLPFVADAALPLGQPLKADAAASAVETVQFGAALEQALLSAALTTLPHPPQDQGPLIDLAAALTEFGDFDAPAAETPDDAASASGQPTEDAQAVAESSSPKIPESAGPHVDTTSHERVAIGGAGIGVAIGEKPKHEPQPVALSNAAPKHDATPPRVKVETPTKIVPAAIAAETKTPAPVRREVEATSEKASTVLDAPPTKRDARDIPAEPDARAPELLRADTPGSEPPSAALIVELSTYMVPVAPRPWAAPAAESPSSKGGTAAEASTAAAVPKDVPSGLRAATAAQQARHLASHLPPIQLPETAAPMVPSPTDEAPTTEPPTTQQSAERALPSADTAPGHTVGFTLPAGMHVLALHTQHARRQIMTRQEKPSASASGSASAPRTAASAAAELGAATEMPTVAAEAIEQLRRPVPVEKSGAVPAEWRGRFEAAAMQERTIERPQETPTALTTDEDAASVMAATTLPHVGERAEAAATGMPQGRDVGPIRAEPTTTSSGSAAPLAAPAASASADPADVQKLKHGVERIAVRLGDDASDPVVRISIRGDAVDARISTSDHGLARELGTHARELRAALEAKGFEQANVQVRGTGSAIEGASPAHLAGPSVTESREAKQSGSEDARQSPDERAQAWKDDRPDQRRQRAPRRFRLDDDEQP